MKQYPKEFLSFFHIIISFLRLKNATDFDR